AIASKAVELGLARIKKSKEEFREIAKHRILRARKIMNLVVTTWSP
ncbi:MAG: malate dehydrogenase, partial [Saccharolobus sp.]